MKIVIIGAVASGAACAARLRRLDENAEIILVERGEFVSYANCGLPYFVGKMIASPSSLLVMTPELMKQRFNIDVRTKTEAIAIDTQNKSVRLKTEDRIYEEAYDKLVLSTGARPFKPAIEGIDSPYIHTLWSVPDAVRVRELAESATHVAVIGGGFVGLETAENLVLAGKKVTLIEASDQVMAPFDPEMATLLHNHLREKGVVLHLSDGVKAFEEKTDGVSIHLSSGAHVDVPLVLLAIGTRPNTELAKAAGIECTTRGFVVVDAHMQTSAQDVYAAGDIAMTRDIVFDEPSNVPLAGPAAKQGRTVADDIAAGGASFDGTQGTSIIKVFDLSAASTGANEKRLQAKGYTRDVHYTSILIRAMSHVPFYPGATPMYIKLLFSPDGNKIFGAQIIGRDGVDKRIDVLATAMRLSAGIHALETLDLAYAPPFGAAKDPVNMAGFVAANVVDGRVRFADCHVTNDDVEFLDVREAPERQVYALPNAIAIPLGELRTRLAELDPSKNYVIFCAVGVRAYNAARILMQNHFEHVTVYPGGIEFYKQMHFVCTPVAAPASDKKDHTDMEQKQTDMHPNTNPSNPDTKTIRLDCCGVQCPGPLMKVYETVQTLEDGEKLEITATDPGFPKDAQAWCDCTCNTLLSVSEDQGKYTAIIQKGRSCPDNASGNLVQDKPDGKTIIVFSGDFDKVMASFIIANGAAAMGRKVTMFFTFWGLTALRKQEKVPVKKNFMEKMFGIMLPRGVGELGLSRMNMGGLGTMMMKKIMNDKNVNTLEDLVKKAIANGVKIIACSMSMDVMGIHAEELIDGVEIAGVGSYLNSAEDANVNLFI